jgi:KGK domain
MGEFYRNIECNEDDVISFGEDTFKVGKFKKAVRECFGYDFGYGLVSLLSNQGVRIDKQAISPQGNNEDYTKWFDEGVDCNILKTDAPGWRKAKIKIKVSIEFTIEESDQQKLMEQQFQETDATIHYEVNLVDENDI